MTAQPLTLSAWNARRLPDENVFDRTMRGDPVAFSEVYRRYQKRIYGYCLARSLDPESAADATQEVFMKLLRSEPGTIGSPRAWLFTIARNVVIDVIRKRARTPEDAGIDEESLAWDRLKAADTADEVLARSDARNAFLALRTIRPRYRTALVMREVHGLTAKEMAEAFETTPGAVDTLVSRARDAFGAAYASLGDLPSACRANIALIYRALGTGITTPERSALDAHLAVCERCRAESKRANDPRRLAALLPFLVPAKDVARGLLERAALAVRTFPEVAVPAGTEVLTQPHAWSLAARVTAGIAAAAIIAVPTVATRIERATPIPANMTVESGRALASTMSGNGIGSAGPSMQPDPVSTAMDDPALRWLRQPMGGVEATTTVPGMTPGAGMTGGTTSGSWTGMTGTRIRRSLTSGVDRPVDGVTGGVMTPGTTRPDTQTDTGGSSTSIGGSWSLECGSPTVSGTSTRRGPGGS